MYLEHRFVGFGCGRVPEEVIYIVYWTFVEHFYRYRQNENIRDIKNKALNKEYLYL